MLYNVSWEVTAAAWLMIICFFAWRQYRTQSEVHREFFRMAFLVLVTDILDVLSAVAISYAWAMPEILNICINTMYFIFAALLGVQTVRYAVCYTYPKKRYTVSLVVSYGLGLVYLLALLVNPFTGILFSFENGQYVHGPLYLAVYFVPCYYMLQMGGVLALHLKAFKKTQATAIAVFIFMALLGPMLQLLFFPNVLLSVFTVALAMLILMFSLETPDYHKLIQTKEELERAKEETEQQREAAQNANMAKTEFLANMSHELRTPINAILGYNELIMRETKESHTTEYAVNIQAASKTLLALINDLLDFSSIMDGTLKIEEAPYQTLSMIQDILTYTEYHTEQKNLDFRYQIDADIPQELFGDMVRIMQIFSNLISNAVKYTSEGTVELTVQWQNTGEKTGNLKIQVRDNGIGMKPEKVAEIRKIAGALSGESGKENCKSGNVQRTGSGLPVVIRLLEQMHGTFSVESAYGQGSIFAVVIGQRIVSREAIGAVERRGGELWHQNKSGEEEFTAPDAKILAVDDNAMNLALLSGNLKQIKIQVDTAENGESALALMKKNTYHLLLLDHMMPDMDGIELLKRIRSENLCPGVPVLVFTANAVAGAREKYLEEGFDDFLSKPISYKQLVQALKMYLPDELVLPVKSGQGQQENQQEQEENGADNPQQEKIAILQKLSFLDTATGLMYCAGSEEFYEEMLKSYLNSGKYETICGFYEKEDWENYRISVHALKSTSLSVGAVAVSEAAKALEAAAKEGDIAYIRQHHTEVMEHYKKLLNQLADVFVVPKEVHKQALKGEGKPDSHILVVDDDSMNLQVAERMLQGKFKTSCVKSGEEALAFLEKELPDLILLDLHMPQMDGFEVLAKLKADADYCNIPVIFLTADDDRQTEVEGFLAGALDFITKPFVADIMVQRISRILELDNLQKHLQREVEKQTRTAEERKEKLERLSLQVIQVLSSTVDAKDKYTSGHSKRVAEYSKELARRMGKNVQEQEDIYCMGLLHDIGKIGIPDEIINKPGKLTDEEYAMIRMHPVIGAEILKNVSEIPGLQLGTRGHHERFDGKGYPDGLKGEEIPVEARIIGVADAYDAMASRRSYRDVLPQEVVRSEIENGKGTQFDAEIADIMLEMIQEDTDYQMHE